MQMKINTIIIEDEFRARELLKEMLKIYTPEINVIGESEDLTNGVKQIRKLKPDLVLLDIEMPNHSGLEILDFFDVNEIDFSIIFTTAYNDYAVQAFKLSAIDYLTKPIESAELISSIERYKKRTKNNNFPKLKELLSQNKKIAIPVGNTIRLIEYSQILYLKADSSYTEIYLTDQSKLVVSRTLKNFEEAFEKPHAFFRCHKSYIVNLMYMTSYIKSEGGTLVLNEATHIPISSEKMEELKTMINMVQR